MSRVAQRILFGLGIVGALLMGAAILLLLHASTASQGLASWDGLLSVLASVSSDRMRGALWAMLAATPLFYCGLWASLDYLRVRGELLRSLTAVLVLSFPVAWVGALMQVLQLSLAFQGASSPSRLAEQAWFLLSPVARVLTVVFWGGGVWLALMILSKRTRLSGVAVLALPHLFVPAFWSFATLVGGATSTTLWLLAWPASFACSFLIAMSADERDEGDEVAP